MQYKYDEKYYPVTKGGDRIGQIFKQNYRNKFFMLNDTPTYTSMIGSVIFELAVHDLETLQKLFKISFNTPKQ